MPQLSWHAAIYGGLKGDDMKMLVIVFALVAGMVAYGTYCVVSLANDKLTQKIQNAIP